MMQLGHPRGRGEALVVLESAGSQTARAVFMPWSTFDRFRVCDKEDAMHDFVAFARRDPPVALDFVFADRFTLLSLRVVFFLSLPIK